VQKQFKKFQPMTQVVNQKINELLNRGGTIILEKKEFIEIKRMQSIAKIDQYGRVEWRPE
jgi:hypothetical protein